MNQCKMCGSANIIMAAPKNFGFDSEYKGSALHFSAKAALCSDCGNMHFFVPAEEIQKQKFQIDEKAKAEEKKAALEKLQKDFQEKAIPLQQQIDKLRSTIKPDSDIEKALKVDELVKLLEKMKTDYTAQESAIKNS